MRYEIGFLGITYAAIHYEWCTRAEGSTWTSQENCHLSNIFRVGQSTPRMSLVKSCRECLLTHALSQRFDQAGLSEARIYAIDMDMIPGILKSTCPS